MTVVSIVVLNWNCYPVVLEAVASATAQQGVTVDLIIVDNGSGDGSLHELKRRFPKARFIEMGFNSGFTGGMNAGTDAARGDFVLWQNADLVLADDYCTHAVAAMAAHPQLGAVGGTVYRLMNGIRSHEFDASGYRLTATHRTSFIRTAHARDVVGISGSCPIFRRAALKQIASITGYVLDPWYFAYGEDIDVMVRLNLAGWRVRYLPEIRAWHVRSGSTAERSRFYQKPDLTQVHHFKNRLATIIKTWPRSVLIPRLPALALIELAMPPYLLGRRPRSILNWARAWGHLWRERRRLLRDRRAIRAATTQDRVRRLRQLLSAAQ